MKPASGAAAITAVMLFLTSAGSEEELSAAGGARPLLARATTKCFSSTLHAAGRIVPRATAVVVFNQPGFRIEEVSVKQGDTVEAGARLSVAVPIGGTAPDGTSPSGSDVAGDASASIPIRALASGVVLTATMSAGMLPSAETIPLATIAVDGEMEAMIDVPSVHALELKQGQAAEISMGDGRSLLGYVRTVPSEIGTGTRFGEARISIDAARMPEGGRVVLVSVETGRACAVAVPLSALSHDGEDVHIAVVKDGAIETRLVHVGLRDETDAEIKDGLTKGETVVTNAGTSLASKVPLRPGTR